MADLTAGCAFYDPNNLSPTFSMTYDLRFDGDVLENLGEQRSTASDLARLNGFLQLAQSTIDRAGSKAPDALRPPQAIVWIAGGRVSSVSFRSQLGRVGRRAIDGLSWTASCGFCERAPLGVIFLRNLVRGRPSGICSTSGMVTELWTRFCGVCRQRR
jgi:hypothetical protein